MNGNDESPWTEKDTKVMNRIIGIGSLLIMGIIISLAPSCPEKTPQFYYEYGQHYMAEKDYIQAQRFFTKAIKSKPDYFDAYYQRAIAWEQTDSIQNSIRDYDSLLAFKNIKGDKVSELYYMRGNMHYLLSQDTLACNDWKRSRDLGYNKAYDRVRNRCK